MPSPRQPRQRRRARRHVATRGARAATSSSTNSRRFSRPRRCAAGSDTSGIRPSSAPGVTARRCITSERRSRQTRRSRARGRRRRAPRVHRRHHPNVPRRGVFEARRKAVYEATLDVQNTAIEAMKPGVNWRVVSEAAKVQTVQRLVDLGLVRGRAEDATYAGVASLFLPHSLGHLLGLQVHDVGPGGPVPERLEVGHVVTCEPGIYFVDGLLGPAFEDPRLRDFLCGIVSRSSWKWAAFVSRITSSSPRTDTIISPSAAPRRWRTSRRSCADERRASGCVARASSSRKRARGSRKSSSTSSRL